MFWKFMLCHGRAERMRQPDRVRVASGDVTLTANTALYSSRNEFCSKEINDLGCAEADLDGQRNGYTQLM
jgi:hypothetical protein